MGEWMSFFETPSELMANRARRQLRIKYAAWVRRPRLKNCSECVRWMDGDVANLADIDGIDFDIINQDLIECDDDGFPA